MADVEISINEKQWADLERLLRHMPRAIPVAAVAAINRTGRTGATRIRRRLAGMLQIGVRKLGNRVKWLRATSSHPHGKIRLAQYNLKAIDTRQKPTLGGMFALGKINNPVPMPNTPFTQKMLSGHIGWFTRVGAPRVMQSGHYVGKMRQPIKEIWTPGAASVWEQSPSVASEELAQLEGILEKNLASQVDRFLNAPPQNAA